jgi:uncharacterized protein YggU (UPF0235/DUF167 family)
MITGSWWSGRPAYPAPNGSRSRSGVRRCAHRTPRTLGNVRISIRVRPGAGRTAVGGAHDGALVVRVAQPAVDGRATEAALAALAQALGVRRRHVTLISGATSRTKVVDVDGADDGLLQELLNR